MSANGEIPPFLRLNLGRYAPLSQLVRNYSLILPAAAAAALAALVAFPFLALPCFLFLDNTIASNDVPIQGRWGVFDYEMST